MAGRVIAVADNFKEGKAMYIYSDGTHKVFTSRGAGGLDNALQNLINVYKEAFNDIKDLNLDRILSNKESMKNALILVLTLIVILKKR